jgi:hypothetical protein
MIQTKNRRRRRQVHASSDAGATVSDANMMYDHAPVVHDARSTGAAAATAAAATGINRSKDDDECYGSYICAGDDHSSDDDEMAHHHRHHRSSKGGERKVPSKPLSFMLLSPSTLPCWQLRRRRTFRRKGAGVAATAPPNDCDLTGEDSFILVLVILMSGALLLLAAVLAVVAAPIPHFSFLGRSRSSLRPVTDAGVDQIAIRIPGLDYDKTDPGGWRYLRRFFLPAAPLTGTEWDNSLIPDYNNVNHNFSSSERGVPIRIPNDETERAELYWTARRRVDPPFDSWGDSTEALEDRPTKCRRPSFKMRYYPTCNAAHEVPLDRDYDPDRRSGGGDVIPSFDSFYSNHGFYRDVWVIHQPDMNVKAVLKMLRWEHSYTNEKATYVVNDAMVMERLSKSPRIIDIYGHCGTTVWVEPIPFEIEAVVVPGTGYIDPKDLHHEDDVRSRNQFAVDEKLKMALAMAESLADLHGHEEGVM